MKKITLLSTILFLTLCSSHAQTIEQQEVTTTVESTKSISGKNPTQISLSLHAGTSGVGIATRVSVSNKIYFRLGYTLMPINYTLVTDLGGLKSNTDLSTNFNNTHLFAEWRPFNKSGFRLVAGAAYFMNATATTTLSPSDKYTVGNVVLTPEDIGKLKIDIDWKGIAPYFGIGLGKGFGKNLFNINFDLGAMYLQSPVCTVTGSGRLSDNAQLGTQLTKNLEDYKWLPLMQINLNFKIK